MSKKLLLAAAATLSLIPAAWAGSVMQAKTMIGYVLTDEKGMTLYTFDKEEMGKIVCTDACAQNWPPMAASMMDKAAGDYGMIKRPDGSMQWTYKGKALYHWGKDMKAGDTMGEGFKDMWHVARP